MKRNKNFWSYRLHKIGTPKVLRTDKCLSSTPLKNESYLGWYMALTSNNLPSSALHQPFATAPASMLQQFGF